MTDVVSICRSTWKQLGVPARARADLEFELRTNLDDAAIDGVDASTFVGDDPGGLAREWAIARGLVRARWLVAGSVVATFAVGYVSLTLYLLLFVGREGSLFLGADSPRLVALFLARTAAWLLVPTLTALGLYLRFAHDSLAVRTVVLALATSPITLSVSALSGFKLEGLGGVPVEVLRISLTFALLLGAIRAAIVAAHRRKSPTSD